jgi:two-component system phosphate regulon sensor histidine kinase PhoR
MAFALLGIILIQVQQVRRAMKLNEENFNSSVYSALNQVVDQLEKAELKTKFVTVQRNLNVDISKPFFPGQNPDSLDNYYLNLDGQLEVPQAKQQRVLIRDSLAIITEQETYITADSSYPEGKNLQYNLFMVDTSSSTEEMIMELRGHPRFVKVFSSVLRNSPNSLEMRLDSSQLDTLLKQALADQGLQLGYDFWVESENKQSIQIGTPNPVSKADHKILLFPMSSNEEKNFLYIDFPNEKSHAMRQVWGQLAISLILVSTILICFGIVIEVVFRQKQLSEMKTDFTNNMTHELKTPIATISLATDAINNPIVRESEDGLNRYTRIIKEENNRMHRQVERVLLAARLDRNEMELKTEPIHIHDLISKAVRNIRLQVQNKGGSIAEEFKASQDLVEGDAVHLTNVIYNLLDNANKYSPDHPIIQVRTYNKGEMLIIEVEDQGIGISKANLQQIFTRFYRVSTGNLHEVKGFGLGLSYVKDITEAHQGFVEVESSLGKGSIFRLGFPVK